MRRLLIDTDCGTDDACAILLAVRVAQKDSDVKIEAITTCSGNVSLSKVRSNVLRVLELCNATEIPVFEGVGRPLVRPYEERHSHLHADDGFGGLSDRYPAPGIILPKEHAVNAMVRLAREFKDELTLVALGPLSNVALAQKLDPEFLSNLKGLVVVGGSCAADGGSGPGFNFTCDPEAVSIVVNEMSEAHKLTIVTKEARINYPLKWVYYDSLDESNKYIKFVKEIMKTAEEHWRNLGHPGIVIHDLTAMAVYLDAKVAAKIVTCPIRVELHDLDRPGDIVLDRRASDEWSRDANAEVCSDLDTDHLRSMFDRLM